MSLKQGTKLEWEHYKNQNILIILKKEGHFALYKKIWRPIQTQSNPIIGKWR